MRKRMSEMVDRLVHFGTDNEQVKVLVDEEKDTWEWKLTSGRDIHMGHKVACVTWWNKDGKHYGPRSPEVRSWMLDPNNYELEYGPINSAKGARM